MRGGNREGLKDFLVDKLRMDAELVDEEMGQVKIRKQIDGRKNIAKDEVCVTFESKGIRDAVKAMAPNLANHPEAGMKLHVPDHLQKVFKALMGLAYDLKKKYTGLRRNIKFDEDNC